MRAAPHPEEESRLATLAAYDILDTPPEDVFNEIVALAAKICEAPVSLVNLIDRDRQFFKAEVGIGGRTAPLEAAICTHALLTDGFLEVPNTTLDPRFADNPLVLGDPMIRFYAGTVLQSEEGLPLGTLCVLDVRPRELTDLQRDTLKVLGHQVMMQFELRRKIGQLTRERAKTLSTEQALEEERLRLQRTVANAQIATFDWNLKNDQMLANDLLVEFFNVPNVGPGQDAITAILASIHKKDQEKVTKVISRAMRTGTDFEVEYRVKGASEGERWILARGQAQLDERGKCEQLSGVVLDITQRKHAESALRDEQEKLRHVVGMAPSFIMLVRGPEFVIEVANEAACRLLQNSDLIGRKVIEVVPDLESQGLLSLLEEVQMTKGLISMTEVAFQAAGGTGERPEPVFIDQTYQALLGPDEDVYGIAIHGIDVTERVRARFEVEKINEELEVRIEERTRDLRSSVREAEGFNYSISHDLRAPLRAINATANILIEEATELLSQDHLDLLHRQAFNAKRLGTLVDDLLRLSRLARVKIAPEHFDLSAISQEILRELDEEILQSRIIEVHEGLSAYGDPQHVKLILANLIENAIKFSGSHGRIEIGTRRSSRIPTYFVKDNGIGFNMIYADKIFLPFERLVREDQYPGTGIGLANVKRIVERHGGRVWVESQSGAGSTFLFTLVSDS